MAQQQGMSFGNQTVRTNFNPGNNPIVGQLKQNTAQLLDLCNQQIGENGQEADRLWHLAQTAYEEACMWATKAATTQQQQHS